MTLLRRIPFPLSPTRLEANLTNLRQRLAQAASSAGRSPSEVELVAVTKDASLEATAELARLGQHDLGENRAQDLEQKGRALAAQGLEVCWHFVGHLQANKVKRVLQHARVLHSIDSAELLLRVDRIAGELGLQPTVYLQIALTGEPEKHGLTPGEIPEVVRAARSLEHLRLCGLMVMGPREDPALATTRRLFEQAAQLATALEGDPECARVFSDRRCRLSMGMSGDFELAIAAGSHLVRVGSALFASGRGVTAGDAAPAARASATTGARERQELR